jgi:hypothetical protein
MSSEANEKSFIELFFLYLPNEVRRSVEEVVDAVTPATIARNDVLLSRRRNEIGELRDYLRDYFVKLLTSAVDSAIEEAVDEAVEKASSASSAASSRSASGVAGTVGTASTAAPSRTSTGSSSSSGTPYSPPGFIHGGTRRHKKKKLSTRRAHRVR